MNDISITIKHEDTTIDFKGHPNDVLHSVNEFLLKSMPGLDLAQKILINYLQVATLARGFPLRWPPALQGLFEFQGAIGNAD